MTDIDALKIAETALGENLVWIADMVDLHGFCAATCAWQLSNPAHVFFVGVLHATTWLDTIDTPTVTMHAPGLSPSM